MFSVNSIRCHAISWPRPWFNIKMSSYQYRKSHCGDKTILRSSYFHNGISYTGKTASLYWIGAQLSSTFIVWGYDFPVHLHHVNPCPYTTLLNANHANMCMLACRSSLRIAALCQNGQRCISMRRHYDNNAPLDTWRFPPGNRDIQFPWSCHVKQALS